MLIVKYKETDQYANVHQASWVTHMFSAMTIHAQLILVDPMLIVKYKETDQYADVHQASPVTHMLGAMTIHAQMIPVGVMLYARLEDTLQSVDVHQVSCIDIDHSLHWKVFATYFECSKAKLF